MSADPIVTLTTDFGAGSSYVAAMKGVLLGLNPAVRLVDLGHAIPPQDVRHAAHFLASAVPCFPPGVLHVVVVDPGVGSDRAILYVELAGQRLLVPDNGCWTLLPGTPARVLRLAEPRYWRQPVSATFHGRDIFAPVAGHLSRGLDPAALGPPVADWVRLALPAPTVDADGLSGEVAVVDSFGNLISNVPVALLGDRPARVTIAGWPVPQRVRTYAEAAPGSLVALISSSGMLEIAVVQGSAARQLGLGVGAPVRVVFESVPAAGTG